MVALPLTARVLSAERCTRSCLETGRQAPHLPRGPSPLSTAVFEPVVREEPWPRLLRQEGSGQVQEGPLDNQGEGPLESSACAPGSLFRCCCAVSSIVYFSPARAREACAIPCFLRCLTTLKQAEGLPGLGSRDLRDRATPWFPSLSCTMCICMCVLC